MSSPIKDALAKFISSNTSAIEHALENGSHDLAKDDPGIDLVSYLSSSTSHSYSKDIEPMSTNEKIEAANLSFNSLDLQLTQQAHFTPCQLQEPPAASPFNTSQPCIASSENNYNSGGMPLNQVPAFSHQDLQQQHCPTHHDSYEQGTSLYSETSLHTSSIACGFPDVQLANPSTFASSNSSDTQNIPNATESESRYGQDEQAAQYQMSSDPNKHFQQSHQTQLLGSDNCADQFQNQPETTSSSFQESSVLAPTFTSSVSSSVSYNGQDSLGFAMMDVNHISLASLQTSTNQFRAPEKMHVDEPEVIFRPQTASSTGIDHYETASAHDSGSPDVHMKSFSPRDFHAHSTLDSPHVSTVTDSGISNCGFQQTLNDVTSSHSVNEFTANGTVSISEITSPAAFDISRDPHQSSAPSTFNTQSFPQSPSVLQTCTKLDFQGQPNLCQTEDTITNPTHYTSLQLDGSTSTESPFSSTSQHNNSSQQSPFQNNQYHDSPGHTLNASPNIPENFQTSLGNTNPPIPSLGLNQNHHLHHVDSISYQQSSSFQPPQSDVSQNHQSDILDLNYSSDAPPDQCPDKQPAGFQNNPGSSLLDSGLFPSSIPSGTDHEQKDYINSSVHQPSTQVNDPSAFLGYCSSEESLLSADICTVVNQTNISQGLTDYEMSSSSGQRHSLDSGKASSDVTMGDFLSGGNLQPSSHVVFNDDSDSFSQLDMEAMVNSFNVETSASTIPQNESIMTTGSYDTGYTGYDYSNLASDSVSFSETSHSAAENTTHFSFEQCQADADLSSCSSTVASAICNQNTGNQFGSSSFGLSSSSEVPRENYHQPMQVQDLESPVPFTYHSSSVNEGTVNNTETAMDVSSSLGEKGGGIISSISYEEIHMSIVKAGNALSKETKDLDLQGLYYNSEAQTSNVDSLGNDSGIYSTSSSGIFEAGKPDTNSAGTYSASSQASVLTGTPPVSDLTQHQSSFNDAVACSNNVSTSDSLSNDSNMFSSILNDLQVESSSQLLHQEQMSQQAPATVPNFLENPETLASHIHTSSSDNLILTANLTQSQPQTSFVVTAATPTNPEILVSGSSSQLHLVGIHSGGIATSQQPVLNALQSSNSFFGQQAPAVDDQTSGVGTIHSNKQALQSTGLTLNGVSGGPESGSSSGAFLHLTSSQADKPSDNSNKLGTIPGIGQKPGSSMIFNGLTGTTAPGGNPPTVLSGSSNKQPHIIVSLEDLQKLLAQQNLSQPSPSIPQQQPYTTMSSPQTLVLQKHASHSLKLSQPRLLIKGATLPFQTRPTHPHQHLQQTREKLQLLAQQSHSSETTGTLSQRHLELNTFSASENRQKISNHFQFASISQLDQQPHQKLHLLQQTLEQQPRAPLQLKQSQLLQPQQQTVNLFLQQAQKSSEQQLAPLQLVGHQQQLVLPQVQQQSVADQKTFVHIESQLHLPQNANQKGSSTSQKAANVIQLGQMQQELLLLLKQQEKGHEFEDQQLQQFHIQHQQHLQPLEKPETTERPCSENLKKDYKHLHSLLTRDTPGGPNLIATQTKALSSSLNLPTNLSGQQSLQLTSGGTSGTTSGQTSTHTLTSVTPLSSARFSFVPLNNSSSLQLTNTSSTLSSSPLTTLAFVKTPTVLKSFETKDSKIETESTGSLPGSILMQFSVKSENDSFDKNELDTSGDHPSNRQQSVLTLTSTERKRSHTPLSVDLNSPPNSVSEPASPLSSPTACEDGNTQLTLIERSADLHIKSDSMHGVDDADDDENASFDVNAFHKRPSADESHSTRKKNESVPMKIAKPSIHADARSGVNPSTSPDLTFDFGSAVTSASNFSFAFGNKEENNSDVFTFGLNGAAATTTTTTDTLLHKDGLKHYRLSSAVPVMKAVGMRPAVPTQPVRPTSRKQKEYSLKAYYPSKLENMELKILQQPEPQHRARYQTEGSRGAIKDTSQQSFPVIKLFGYNKPAKLQVFIGDECGRVKPHGFYQACRVFGKNSTTCVEQEIEDTTVIEIEMMPENDMTVKLDCVGILKLRNADVERRIGPKRAREKKKTNTRARLVMRCLVDKSDGSQNILQVVSNPIVCTQPVGQPEICRMSLSESSLTGGDSLFIIGKNFKNKGTSVLFQKLDANDESVVWQVEAEIEQEFFQPTHLICKVPPYKDQTVDQPQLAQIVVSCAGKISDPHNFTYKPAPSIKQEIPMDTDNSLSTRSMSFVSPEALHLNRMVQLTNTHSVPTTTIMFQLPRGTIPSNQTSSVEASPTTMSSQLIRPVRLLGQSSSQTPVMVMAATTTASATFISATSNGSTLATSSSSGQTLPSFLLEDKPDGLVSESSSNSSGTGALLSSTNQGDKVNCVVHSNSDSSTVSPLSYTISDSHEKTSLTSTSVSGTDNVVHSDRQSSSTKSSSSLPSKPFYVVVDPTALQSQGGSEKIQQLLQHILEAQSHV